MYSCGDNMKLKSENIGIIIFKLTALTTLIQCIDFDRNLFGVIFKPGVKHEENGSVVHDYNYTFQNLKTMLKVVSTKFTRILVSGPLLSTATYVRNYTYYNPVNIRIRIAEAAAVINAERSSKSILVIIATNLFTWKTKSQTQSDLHMVVEAAKISNSIYPGTVIGLQLNGYITFGLTRIDSVSFWMTKLRDMTAGLGIRIGLSVFNEDLDLLPPPKGNNSTIFGVWDLSKQVVLNSDFIAYQDGLNLKSRNLDIGHLFGKLSSKVTDFRNRVQEINKNVEVMWSTYFLEHYQENDSDQTNKRRAYWAELNKYAIEEVIPVWIERAFDIPPDNTGWWKLVRNDLINNVSGYVEKYSSKPANESQTPANVTTRSPYKVPSRTHVDSFNVSAANLDSKSADPLDGSGITDIEIFYLEKNQSAISGYQPGDNTYITVVVSAVIGGLVLTALIFFVFTRWRKFITTNIANCHVFELGFPKSSNETDYKDGLGVSIRELDLLNNVSLEVPKAQLEICK